MMTIILPGLPHKFKIKIPGDFDYFFQEQLQQNILKSEWLNLKLCKLDSFSKKFSAPLNIILATFTLESTLTGLFSTQVQSGMYTENINNWRFTLWRIKSKQTSSEWSI